MPKINITAKMPKVPDTLPIYSALEPKVDQAELHALARKFNLGTKGKFGSQHEDNRKLKFVEGQFELALHKASGAFRFKDNRRWQVDDGESSFNLSDAEIIQTGKKHIEKLQLAKPNEFQHLRTAHLHVGHSDIEGKHFQERIIDAGICFQRNVNGVPVDGPGGKIEIYIDHEKNPTSIHQTWRGLGQIYKEVKLHPAQHALDELKILYPGEQGELEVHTIRFGYFELGSDERQQYIQPAYVILFRLKSSDERFVMNSAYVSPASTQKVEDITPPAPGPVKQTPRKPG